MEDDDEGEGEEIMQTLVGEETEEEETDVESDGEAAEDIFELFQNENSSKLTCDQGNLDTLQIAITCNKMSQFKEIIVSMK